MSNTDKSRNIWGNLIFKAAPGQPAGKHRVAETLLASCLVACDWFVACDFYGECPTGFSGRMSLAASVAPADKTKIYLRDNSPL
jgi:hypothetical protein